MNDPKLLLEKDDSNGDLFAAIWMSFYYVHLNCHQQSKMYKARFWSKKINLEELFNCLNYIES